MRSPGVGERDIGASGVPPVPRPLGFAVANEIYLHFGLFCHGGVTPVGGKIVGIRQKATSQPRRFDNFFASTITRAQGLVADFEFHPAFLEEVAALLRLDPASLYQTMMQKVSIDEPLESLCRLLMQEVEQGCPHGSAFFEPLSRALAAALVRRVAVARPVAGRDWRIERAVRLYKQQHRQRMSMEEAVRATGLSRYQFFRRFRAAVGISPHRYLLRWRLDYARQLILCEGHRRSLADIATEAGFYDQARLCRHFRRVFGQSPGRLLRAH